MRALVLSLLLIGAVFAQLQLPNSQNFGDSNPTIPTEQTNTPVQTDFIIPDSPPDSQVPTEPFDSTPPPSDIDYQTLLHLLRGLHRVLQCFLLAHFLLALFQFQFQFLVLLHLLCTFLLLLEITAAG